MCYFCVSSDELKSAHAAILHSLSMGSPCKKTGLSVSSSNAGGVGEPAPGGGKMTPWVPVCFRAFRPPLPGRLANNKSAVIVIVC